MSSMLCSIRLCDVIRQHGECLSRFESKEQRLDLNETLKLSAKYQGIWESAPLFYRSISWEGDLSLQKVGIMVQSWMLQQGIFHKLSMGGKRGKG